MTFRKVNVVANDDKPKRSLGARVKETAGAVVNFVKAVSFDAFARFKAEENEIDFPVDFEQDTVWANRDQLVTLFGVTHPVIDRELKQLFNTGEFDEQVVSATFTRVGTDGQSRPAQHFNLDVILAIGFKTDSKKAAAFRKWAANILKGYIQDGYALNGKRLNSDPAALLKLAQEVRAIRTSEKNLYSQVREAFAQCAIDYDKDDPAARTFFATSQDTFHYAASGQTAVQIIMARADASKPNMGAIALGNRAPTVADITTAKNYCSADELRKMELIGEAWLLYAEGMALQGKQVSMERLLSKLKELVAQYEFPVFPGYGSGPKRDDANKFAKAQLELFKKKSRLGS